MKHLCLRSLCLALFVTVVGCAARSGQTEVAASAGQPGNPVSISYFYDNLSPYGEWIQNPSYGWCWTPYDMSADWRPYSDGQWQYTDYGWSWASNETWGWAPYHYGRWFFDDSYGWAWVPGTEWAPAWVAWRYGDGWVGWAPLPPSARWDAAGGLAYGDADAIPSHEWCFVPQEHLLDRKLRQQVTSVARNVTLFGRSREATRFEARDGRPANVGLDVAQVEHNVGRRVARVQIIDVDTPGRGRPVGHDAVGVFRPTIRPTASGEASAPSVARHPNSLPDPGLQRLRDEQQRRIESDLKAERARLAHDQAEELRALGRGPGSDELRRRHAAEQQAFQQHAEEQRRVTAQRVERQIVKPSGAERPGGPGDRGKGKGHDQGGD